MNPLRRALSLDRLLDAGFDGAVTREWLVANGIGGFASGTVGGAATRRYHALLVAALPALRGRRVMLSHLGEEIAVGKEPLHRLDGEISPDGELRLPGLSRLVEFALVDGLPRWKYRLDGAEIEKRILLPHGQNTVYASYRVLGRPRAAVRIILRPYVHYRPLEVHVGPLPKERYRTTADENGVEIEMGEEEPVLRLYTVGPEAPLRLEAERRWELFYRLERDRGYSFHGELWSPGEYEAELGAGDELTLVASTESFEVARALTPAEASFAEGERRRRLREAAPGAAEDAVIAELALAADAFLIRPVGRRRDMARARAMGEEIRTVIAGYHWFTDWGRDTMISLEGLTLTTGRHREAAYILRTYSHYVREGLIPNLFPDGAMEGLYHTADATLWYFHAIDRYVSVTGDRRTLASLLPVLAGIIDHHRRGTRFGIGVDPDDGLLRQGAEGYQLTWMDAKAGDWVVTPRRGKPVEINALWYNALRLMERWATELGASGADEYGADARRARESFNARFWYEPEHWLYDVVDGEDGDDPACRPNQVFAVSLPNPVLEERRWADVVGAVEKHLLTPVGLRSLSPHHPDYKPEYFGDLRTRDAAYHQGTVWAWLIGPFIDAYLKVHPDDRRGAREKLHGFLAHLDEAGVGSVSEIFDAEAPYRARGCIAQAWSVAELLRAWRKTAPESGRPERS